MNNKKVIIIGSGLSAYAAILAAIDKNYQVTVLDVGERLPNSIANNVNKLNKANPEDISLQLMKLSEEKNSNKLSNKKMPQKTLFGSKYFYKELKLKGGQSVPYTEAFGGYSVAWGAAVLAPQPSDLEGFPAGFQNLEESLNFIANKISLPHFTDPLAEFFPNFGESSPSINLSASQQRLLKNISRLNKVTSKNICVSGQARVATKANGDRACQYCGMCSHGCVFNSIFSSEREISNLVSSKIIDYQSQKKVVNIFENSDATKVIAINSEGGTEEFLADLVFVAAGAINSTKIAMAMKQSKEKIFLQKTGGFVRPYFSMKKNGFDWPDQNTQSNIFLEIRNPRISKYWIHSQISTPNEIVVQGLGFLNTNFLTFILTPLRKILLSHLVIVMTNLHSNDGPFYKLDLSDVANALDLSGELVISKDCRKIERKIDRYLITKFFRVGMIALPFGRKGITNGPGYHLGGSLKMGGKGTFGTDSLGRLSGSKKVHFVDTSVLPSIPATTIGFLTMANAHRIVKTRLSTETFE